MATNEPDGDPVEDQNDSSTPQDDSHEPDGDAPEAPQEPAHPKITVPKGKTKTNESLRILGAGQPYINRNT